MNHGRASFRHHSLFTIVAVLALAQTALADDLFAKRSRAVDAVVTPILDLAEADASLPRSLGAWSSKVDELDLREAHSIVIDLFPQGRMAARQGFFDWSQWELGAFAGLVNYSADFEAGISYIFGVTTRVPVPGLGSFGFYGDLFISYVKRDLPFYYDSRAGTWFGLGLGVDYTIWKGSLGYVRAKAGVMYAYWNGVNSLDNGIGITVGVQVGVFWIKNNDRTSITLTPQFHFDGSDHMIFLPVGFSVDF